MTKIHVLDSDTINQIAAGEVVERPASVVKELVENAIDAGASSVTVEIKDGGINFIRITDNGSGIPKDDIRLAFCRHATSKIATALDLLSVKSLGFRGEALSSIASVSMVELVTKTREEFIGIRYCIEGGEEKSFSEIGAPEGTTFLIRSLFYNTPARRKFLKTPMTEAGYISDLMERFSISHPEVSFKFINQNKTLLQTAGNRNLKDCIYHIYGREIAAALIEIAASSQEHDIHVSGFAGKPVISRGNRNYENYFINGRYIKSNIICKAIEEAYKPYSMQHKYPFTVLSFQIPPEQIDVNVHPTKLEIRFENGEELYQLVYRTIRDALSGKNMIPDVVFDETKKEKRILPPSPEPFEQRRLYKREELRSAAEKKREQAILEIQRAQLFSAEASEKKAAAKVAEHSTYHVENKQESEPLSAPDTNAFKPAALPEKSGYAAENTLEQSKAEASVSEQSKAKMHFSEQKNFSEQIKTEEEAFSARPTPKNEADAPKNPAEESAAALLQQTVLQMSLFEAEEKKEAFLKKERADHHHIIGQLFETYWLVEFEEQLFIIDQHAAHEKILYERTVARMQQKEALSQMISPPVVLTLNLREEETLRRYMNHFLSLGFEIEEFGGRAYTVSAVPADLYGINGRELLMEMLDSLVEEPLSGTPELILNRIASLSCKAAVKGNTRLSQAEAKALIDKLMTLENPFHCPHGRPVIISMTRQEVERKFKRIVN